ncbi:MAG: NAD-dependent DNA ligase LigA [Candidatus Omnitrophota bacterium]|nr:NAD-dependent DNA ligase LigA [Candidatus Omnitrophota bacterium]
MPEEIKKKIEALRQEIRRHDYNYYVLSQPEISDKEYDELMRALRQLEAEHPRYITPDSPSQRVAGSVLEGFTTVKHRQKMLSLENTYSFDELKDWVERVHKGLAGASKVEYVAELKIDGVSASLTYQSGSLVSGVTRGDGETGEDVTLNIKTIGAIPLVLLGKDLPDLIEIRGEVYMERKEFDALNIEKEGAGEVLFANPRNAASGSLKLLDIALMRSRRLNFFAHSLGEYKGTDLTTHWDFLRRLKLWGLRINPESRLCRNLEEVLDYCAAWQQKRDKLPYEIDGVVVKLNDIQQHKRLGTTQKSPRWAIAYKFPARQATTILRNIKLQVGRTGVITPVAELDPVECAGVVIKNATLHNFDEIRRLKIKVGDRILIERAGDVIPKVVKVTEHTGKINFAIPRACPECRGKVIKEKEEDVAFRCINPLCPAQLERSLEHFASRGAMDIEGMGEAVVEQLVRLKIARDFADIYKLKAADLAKLELFKEKKINNLLAAIEKSKKQPLSRLIFALGIRHVGVKAAYVLARRFGSLEKLESAKLEELDKIYEVGSVVARSIVDFFSQPRIKDLAARLKKEGLNFKESAAAVKRTALSGKSVVFTGELKDYSRLQAQEAARAAGADPSADVSKNTDFVIAGSNPGSKYDKAKKLGVKVISEEEFKGMIK